MSSGPASGRLPVILNVNDTPGSLYFTSKVLRNAGFDVLQAQSGQAAVELARDTIPDLILLDIKLPDIDGFVVARSLRVDPRTRAIPIIHTSATFVTSDKKAEALEAGGDAYLSQPFEGVELVALVRSLLRMRAFEVEARERAEELLEADRHKNEFLAMLAHELRNPLSAMGAAITLLRDGEQDAARSKKLHDTLDRQTRHLARLVDDLLDISRITHGKVHLQPRRIALKEAVTSAVEGARPAFERSEVTLRLSLPDAPADVDGDPTRLEQIVSNLLDNALKYTPSGGTVTVDLTTIENGHRKARLSVKDTGAGIDAAHIDDLFQLFFQGDTSLARAKGGLGIGLTMVRRLVELHGGTIRATSEGLGRGTEFKVELPLLPLVPEEKHAAAPAKASPSKPVKARRVLLVDDNIDSCELFQFALERVGHHVEVAHDGETGLRMLENGSYDVAVIDIGLPLIDGYEVARRARATLGDRAPRLIAMTGYGQPQDRETALSAGFHSHLLKPVDPPSLAANIGEL